MQDLRLVDVEILKMIKRNDKNNSSTNEKAIMTKIIIIMIIAITRTTTVLMRTRTRTRRTRPTKIKTRTMKKNIDA